MIGDHIRVSKGGRWVHGIDCGDETVLHAIEAAPPGAAGVIRRSYRPEFVAGADAVEVVTHRARVYAAPTVVARAFSRRADPALAAMFTDSEAFAAWCKIGRLPQRPSNVALPAAPAESAPRRRPRKAAPARRSAKAARAGRKAAAAGKRRRSGSGARRQAGGSSKARRKKTARGGGTSARARSRRR